jgi:phosphatidylcholine synthase
MPGLAFCVHILTASGAALALLALVAAARSDWSAMFLWLGAGLIVDAIDGPLARVLDVKTRLPRWSGDVLDLVVDFTTYVFVPAYAIAASGLMPGNLGLLAGAIVAVAGALYFADREMKTADNFFQGFPAVWNLIAFYLLLLWPAAWASFTVVALFAVLTFLPVRFVHPLRVREWRALTISLLILWSLLALVAAWQELQPPLAVTAALCAIAVYFLLRGVISGPGHRT